MRNIKIYCVTNKILNLLDDSNYNLGWVGNEEPPKNYILCNDKDNIFWWTNEISTRNTFVGPFFHYFCSVHFVIELIKQPNFKFQKIIVDTKSFKNIIESIVKKIILLIAL